MPKDSSDQQYIAYLLQRIETLEQRTERNEYAVVGVNRRVDGLNNLITAPVPRAPIQTPAMIPKGEMQYERRNPTEPAYQPVEQQPELGDRGQTAKAKRKAASATK
jgi:hypothetical protein